MKYIKTAFAFFIFLKNISYGQLEYRVDRLPLDEGISHNVIYSITQDPNKFLWLGTMFGLIRYDGKEFVNFRSDSKDMNTLSDDDIVTIHSSDSGEVWVGTFGGGFNSVNYFSDKVTRYTPENTGIADWSGIVWDIKKDNKSNVWVATNNKGILKLNTVSKKIEQVVNSDSVTILPSNFIRNILLDDYKVWFAGYGGLSVYDPIKKSSKIYRYGDVENFFIRTVLQLNENEFLCGTSKGLFTFDKKSGMFSKNSFNNKNLEDASINSIVLSSAGYLWIGTENGLFICDLELNVLNVLKKRERELYSDSIVSLHEDHSGNIWVGSYQGGIAKVIVGKQKFNFVEIGSSPDSKQIAKEIKDLVVSDNKIWVVSGKRITLFNDQFKTLKIYNNLNNLSLENQENNITSLVRNSDGDFFVGTSNGLYRTDKGFRIKEKFNREDDSISANYITKLFIDSRDNLWIGTTWGLSRLENKSDQISNWVPNIANGLTGNNILSIYEDIFGNILVGTYRGLNIVNPHNGEIKFIPPGFNDATKLSNKYVFDFYEPDSSQLWIATGNGINIYNRNNETIEYITTNDGLENGVIKSIQNYKDNIFIGTNNGISIYGKGNNNFSNFDYEDGIGNSIFSASCSRIFKDSLIVIGGNNGLTIVNLKYLKQNQIIPSTEITSLSIFNKSIGKNEWEDELKLKHTENTITIKFASLEFTNPSKNKFSYMLSGIDNDWVTTFSNSVTYHALTHDNYEFKIKSSNNDGVWNDHYASIEFSILPPFWKTGWFYIIVALCIISLALFLHYKRVQNKIKVFLKIEEAKQLENEVVRNRAAEDFHDELGHHLTRISLLIELLKSKYRGNEGDEHLTRLGILSKELSTKMRDFIWSLDSKNSSLYDLIIRLKDFGDDLFYDTNASFSVNGISDEMKHINLSLDWRRHLTLIFKEAMNNIVKYSNCNKVELLINVDDNFIELELKDDGKGFDFSNIKFGNGLKNMRSRAERLKAKLAIVSNLNKGTQIKLEGLIT